MPFQILSLPLKGLKSGHPMDYETLVLRVFDFEIAGKELQTCNSQHTQSL